MEGSEAAEYAEDDASLGAYKPLHGRLVEIFGMEDTLAKSINLSDPLAECEEIDVEGRCGRCVDWFEPEQKYVVETFEGELVGIPEENLREWFPLPPEEGGFDLVWPGAMDSTEEFGMMVCGELAAKGYCVVQTFLSQKEREEAMEVANGEDGMRPFERMQQEIEAGYMGFDNNTKTATLDEDLGEGEATNPLEACGRQVSAAAMFVAPYAPASCDFNCTGLQKTLIRMSIDKMDEDELFPEALVDMMDEEADWSAAIQNYVRFVQCRRASVLYMIENEGGDLWLYPKDSSHRKSIRIPISSNKLLVFRHDLMDYSYQVTGRSLALQSWMLDHLKNSQRIKEISLSLTTPEATGAVVINPGPQVPDGPKASIMTLTTRLPGEVWNATQYWCMFASGNDTCTKWPFMRWECDPYYEEGCDSNATGKSYTCHGGFVSQDQITQFDNEFFGITHDEARTMVPGQWMCTEVGYAALVGAGFNKKSLRGRRIGVWLGDVGPDWGSFQTEWGRCLGDVGSPSIWATSMSNAATASRLSHLYDLKGPVSSYDTACSASLVAMNAAHYLMFDGQPAKEDDSEALVSGVNTLLGPGSFIGNCMATMLSHQGRCFTFNRAADGYQRGEGCASIFLKLFTGDKRDEDKRVCALIGTSTNQDGRSASLTAPNGPAQQAVIRKSMGFAGINPNTVSIAECHGTGTALGDPIEVGALMAVMHQREFAIMKTSAKSNIAHLEAGAGIAGLTKCIMMINMATAPPNCHFNTINAHLMIDGYPVIFDTEVINTDFSSLYCGVSSFGFGGTNSRADVYGYASKGHKAVIKVELPKLTPPRVIPIGQPVYISGTWDNWKAYEQLKGGRFGTYTCSVIVGETRMEQFQLSCDQGGLETIHPLVPEADSACQIVGPDFEGRGLNFMIDARKDGVPVGTVYNIEFHWGEDRKTISWRPTKGVASIEDDEIEVIGRDFEHRYYLTGSWRKWKGYQELIPMGSGVYEGSFTVGPTFREEFQIARDKDSRQTLYPATHSGSVPTKTSVPVCGPDRHGVDSMGVRNSWVVSAAQHEDVLVRLIVANGQFTVSVTPSTGVTRTWLNFEAWAQTREAFYVTGPSTNGEMIPMMRDGLERRIHTCQIELDFDGFASFQISADSGRSLVLSPDGAGELRLSSDSTQLNAWFISGRPGATYELKLDVGQSDRSRMVSWEPLDGKAIAY